MSPFNRIPFRASRTLYWHHRFDEELQRMLVTPITTMPSWDAHTEPSTIDLHGEPWSGSQLIVLANREPVSHEYDRDGSIVATHSSAGLVNAVEPLVRACSGVWIAHGGGGADRLTAVDRDGLALASDRGSYRLRRVWLDEDEQREYYDGFANEALWPLCHRAHVRPVFRSDDLNTYWTVNGRFADAVKEEAGSEAPLVLVQDYHFALAPRMIRERLPHATIMTFWHIPWPHWQGFEICPWRQQLLEGLLGSDIVGFQTAADCRNFLDAVEHTLEAHVERDEQVITYGGHRVQVRAYPASVEWPSRWLSRLPRVEICRREVRRELHLPLGVRLGVGVDRLDYTKGIEEKFLAVERLLDCYPEFRESFVFVQIAEPSRQRIPAYRAVRARVIETADRINVRFGTGNYRPILLVEDHHDPCEVARLLRAADVCFVGSVHDGMNLVSKEFVSARDDERGVLVLSEFAGAARELSEALLVNPYDVDQTAHALLEALTMPAHEQCHRMRQMRTQVAEFNAHRWAQRIIVDAARTKVAARR
jgi:trehalose 6-phosphate synthase